MVLMPCSAIAACSRRGKTSDDTRKNLRSYSILSTDAHNAIPQSLEEVRRLARSSAICLDCSNSDLTLTGLLRYSSTGHKVVSGEAQSHGRHTVTDVYVRRAQIYTAFSADIPDKQRVTHTQRQTSRRCDDIPPGKNFAHCYTYRASNGTRTPSLNT